MSTLRKTVLFSVATVILVSSLLCTSLRSSGQDSPTGPDEVKRLESLTQRLSQAETNLAELKKHLSEMEKSLVEVLKSPQQPSKAGLSELAQYNELKKLKDQEAKGRQKLRDDHIASELRELKSKYRSNVMIRLNNAGKPAEIEGKIDGVEEHDGVEFLRIKHANGSFSEARWAAIDTIESK